MWGKILAHRYVSGLIIISLALLFWAKVDSFFTGALPFVLVSVCFTIFLLVEFSPASFVYSPVETRDFCPR